jgi:ribosomal-protein-alanine N-acetyltransferase
VRALESFVASGGEVLLATRNGLIVGFLAARRAADEIEILNLAVLPEFRRKRFGRQLVEAALREAGEAGAQMAHLEVRCSNQAAIAFYEGCGFRPTGRRQAYYSNPLEDALLMERALAAP